MKSLIFLNILISTAFIALGCSEPKRPHFNHPASAEEIASGVLPLSKSTCGLEVFGQTVWAPALSKSCQSCHIKNGLAAQSGSKFVLLDASEPGYMPQNLAAFLSFATPDREGKSLLLDKATGAVPHVGGKVIDVESPAYQTMEAFLQNKKINGPCLALTDELVQNLELRKPAGILRQASLQLASRQPTSSELQDAGNGKLSEALDSVMTGPNFEAYIKRVYNDIFLGDGFRGDNLIDFLYRRWGQSSDAWRTTDSLKGAPISELERAVLGAFPLYQNSTELVNYIVANDRPYTELLTADYLMMNPYSACDILGKNHSLKFSNRCSTNGTPVQACDKDSFRFRSPGGAVDDCREFLPGKPNFKTGTPVIGVLTDIPFLVTNSTTPSNLNRKRASLIYKTFLGLDVLSLQGPQQIDESAAGSATAPTRNDPRCAACHALVDPIAGGLQHFDADGIFRKDAVWDKTIFPPGFEGKNTPANVEPLQWLAQELVKDPRFARNTVAFWTKTITGQEALPDPPQSDANYRENLAAKLEQNAFFDRAARKFSANGFKIKALIKDILNSPYYAATGLKGPVSASERIMLSSFDHANRRTPEETHLALQGVTGLLWMLPGKAYDPALTTFGNWDNSYLLSSKQLLVTAGGVDSMTSIVRNSDMSSVAAAVFNFAATSLPCRAVPSDFLKAPSKRDLFPLVEVETLPDDATGTEKIRQTIVQLHRRILGETLSREDPETNATYQLFVTLYENHKKSGNKALDANCKVGTITSDNSYTLYAWMGVISYLLNDYDFIYQ